MSTDCLFSSSLTITPSSALAVNKPPAVFIFITHGRRTLKRKQRVCEQANQGYEVRPPNAGFHMASSKFKTKELSMLLDLRFSFHEGVE